MTEQTKKSNPWWKEVLKTLAPVIVVLGIFKLIAFSYAPAPLDHAELERARASDEPVLLEFHASWCSTCLIQRNSLNYVYRDPAFSKIRRFTLNYDVEKQLETDFHVTSQSTLILLRGRKELARTVGTVSPSELSGFLKHAL